MNGLIQPEGNRRVMSTGLAITLIAAGAILRFALAAGSPHGLNVHAAGVVLILAGILGLLLSPLAGGPRRRNRPDGDDRTTPTLVRQRSVYQDQPPA